MKKLSLLSIFLMVLCYSSVGTAAERLCLEGICIGDDVDNLDVKWKPIKLDYKTQRAAKGQLLSNTIDEVYYEFNEKLITDQETLIFLAPYITLLQKFDGDVLKRMARVKAICTPLSLSGEVENDSRTKLLVTFRVVADEGGRGRLRVVQLEKEFNIFPPHLRPNDKDAYVAMIDTLQKDYPGTVLVRDIDARAMTNDVAFAPSLVGFRFFSDVYTPLTFRIRDLADIESIIDDPKRSSLCPIEE